MSVPYLLTGDFTRRSMPGDQRLDDALHLHAPRALHQEQITRADKSLKKICRALGRFEELGSLSWQARRHGAFDELRRVARDADDPIDLSCFGCELSRLAMQFRRKNAQFAHLAGGEDAAAKVWRGS